MASVSKPAVVIVCPHCSRELELRGNKGICVNCNKSFTVRVFGNAGSQKKRRPPEPPPKRNEPKLELGDDDGWQSTGSQAGSSLYEQCCQKMMAVPRSTRVLLAVCGILGIIVGAFTLYSHSPQHVIKQYKEVHHGDWVKEQYAKNSHGQLILKEREVRQRDERPLFHAHYKNADTFHGSYKRWDRDGNLIASGDFLEGNRQGRWEYYDIEKNLSIQPIFDEETLHGKCTLKSADGGIVECEYENGQPHGQFVAYYKNGQKAAEGSFIRGKPANDFRAWKEDGTLDDVTDLDQSAQTMTALFKKPILFRDHLPF